MPTVQKKVQTLLIYSLLIVPLSITPGLSTDPYNPIKLLILSTIIIGSLPLLVRLIIFNRISTLKHYWFLLPFLFVAIASNLLTGLTWDTLFGDFARNTGLLATFLFVCLFMLSYSFNLENCEQILKVLAIGGLVNVLSALLPLLGIFRFDWNYFSNQFNGTLGNPNFFSTFVGISGICIMYFIISTKIILLRLTYIAYIILVCFLLIKSNSIQGLFVLTIGLIILTYYQVIPNTGKFFRFLFYALLPSSILLLLSAFMFNLISNSLLQESLFYRFRYWRVSYEIAIQKPWFGVGFDNFGDWHRQYRALDDVLARGFDTVTSSPHNLYLDMLVSGGIPLLVSFVLLQIYVLKHVMSGLKVYKQSNPVYICLLAIWVAYIAQSLISPKNLAIEMIGWLISGIVFKISLQTRTSSHEHVGRIILRNRYRAVKAPQYRDSDLLFRLLGGIIGLSISIGPIVQDMSVYSALKSRSFKLINDSLVRWPSNIFYFNYVISLIDNPDFDAQRLTLAQKSVEINIRNYDGWRAIYLNSLSSDKEKFEAYRKMTELDPNTSNFLEQRVDK